MGELLPLRQGLRAEFYKAAFNPFAQAARLSQRMRHTCKLGKRKRKKKRKKERQGKQRSPRATFDKTTNKTNCIIQIHFGRFSFNKFVNLLAVGQWRATKHGLSHFSQSNAKIEKFIPPPWGAVLIKTYY